MTQLLASLSSLASLSNEAATLAQSLTSAIAEVEITKLKTQIAQLQQEITRLTFILNQPDEIEWTENQLNNAYVAFVAFAATQTDFQLSSMYTYEYLTTLPQELRCSICTTLVDRFEANKSVAPKLWSLLVARQGVF